jgi:hypothetical protein
MEDGRTDGKIGIFASWGRVGAWNKNSLFFARTAKAAVLSETKNLPLS